MNNIYFIPKTANEAIGRLESLKMYCEHEMESGENGCSIWAGDIAALEIAIKVLGRQIGEEVKYGKSKSVL